MASMYPPTIDRPSRAVAEAVKRAGLIEQIRELRPHGMTYSQLVALSTLMLTNELDRARREEARALRARRRMEAANA